MARKKSYKAARPPKMTRRKAKKILRAGRKKGEASRIKKSRKRPGWWR